MRLFDTIISREEIRRGWSADRKYRAVAADGTPYFLRLSPPEQLARRRREFAYMRQVQNLGVSMSDPIEFGLCQEGSYTLLRWIGGRDAELVLPELDEAAQYVWGRKAGRMLRTIHTIPAPEGIGSWTHRFGQKLEKKLAAYESCPLQFDGGERLRAFVLQNRHLLQDRPQTFQHGDFHCGNLMFEEEMRLTVIDFDRADFGDPWYEFNRIIWDGRAAPEYARGMVDGYFDGEVPGEFWGILALYLCQNMLASLPWAVTFGDREVRTAMENVQRVLDWYGNMTRTVPNWYREG